MAKKHSFLFTLAGCFGEAETRAESGKTHPCGDLAILQAWVLLLSCNIHPRLAVLLSTRRQPPAVQETTIQVRHLDCTLRTLLGLLVTGVVVCSGSASSVLQKTRPTIRRGSGDIRSFLGSPFPVLAPPPRSTLDSSIMYMASCISTLRSSRQTSSRAHSPLPHTRVALEDFRAVTNARETNCRKWRACVGSPGATTAERRLCSTCARLC